MESNKLTVFLPRGFDDDQWRSSPQQWAAELKERGCIAPDGTAEFHVADILGTIDVEIELIGGEVPAEPAGTDFVVCLMDGDHCDQGDTVAEIVTNMRESMADYDWPLEVSLIFWSHHQHTQRFAVTTAPSPSEGE